MMQKKILRPDRLRQVPAQFSWIDQRLVRENFLRHGEPAAWALYLVLVIVADAQGLSYYSEATLSRLLKLDLLQLAQARRAVGQRRFGGLPQTALSGAGVAAGSGSTLQPRSGQSLSVGDILRRAVARRCRMIDYQTFHQIRHLRDEEHLSAAQIAQALALDERTVSKWIDVEKYQPRQTGKRQSKLDPFKSTIVRLLAQHPYTAKQLLQRLKEGGYAGGYSILKEYRAACAPGRRAGVPDAPLCSRPVGPGGLGQRRRSAGGPHATPAFVLRHGALLQPPDVCRVHPGANPGTLPGLPPACL